MPRASCVRVAGVLLLAAALVRAGDACALEEGPVGAETGDTVSPIEGLDTSADAEDQTGAARTRVPIAVPPGRGGLEPKVVLTYSSQRGSGLFGAGWDLTIGRVERSTRNGAPRYDGTDAFVAILPDGAYELAPLAGGGYGARIDDVHFRAAVVGNSWTLHESNGRTWEFGTAAESRVGPNPSVVDSTFAWHLNRITDASGNTLTVSYYSEDGNGYPRLLDASYGGRTGGAVALSVVHFDWTPRVGVPLRPSYAAGFRQLPASSLSQITETFGGSTVRSHLFEWVQSPVSGGLLLSRVRQFGSDQAELLTVGGQPAAPSFSYFPTTLPQGSGPDLLHGGQVNTDVRLPALSTTDSQVFSAAHPNSANNCTTSAFLDMNGDGLPDAVTTEGWDATDNPHWTVYFNQGNATFGGAFPWASPARCVVYEFINSDPGSNRRRDDAIHASAAVMDMNGDGLPDLVRIDSSDSAFIRINWNTGIGFDPRDQPWSAPGRNQLDGFRSAFRLYENTDSEGQGGTVTVAHTQADLIDLNGDGRPDWVTTAGWNVNTNTWTVRWNQGNGFSGPQPFTAYRNWLREGGGSNPARNIDADVFDVNGDGLVDYVEARGQVGSVWQWNVWYGTGRGFAAADTAGTPFRIGSPPRQRLRSWDPSTNRFDYDVLDVNGDRLPDFVDATAWANNNKQWLVYRNNGAYFEASPILWDAPAPLRRQVSPGTTTSIKSDTFDLDGNGYPDIIDLGTTGTVAKVWLYHPLPYRPDALSVVRNALGGETHFSYAVSTSFNHGTGPYVDPDLGAGYHGLPFPLFVVSSLQRWAVDLGADGWSLTQYTYDGGVWASDRREFRGFRTVSKRDHYGALEATVYHQSDVLHGRVAQRAMTNQYGPYGALRVVQNSWVPIAVGGRFVLELQHVARTLYSSASGNDVPWTTGNPRTTTIDYQYDGCGNVVRQVTSGEGASVTQVSSFTSEPHNTCTTDRVCPSAFCDRSATTQTTDSIGGRPLGKSFSYDGSGNTLSVAQAGPGTPTTTYTYDSMYGHLTSITDPKGHVTTISYDSAWNLFPYDTVRDANGAALRTRTQFDGRFGTLSSTMDPNDAVTRYDYDAFGRRTAVAEPGQTLAAPTTRTAYFIGTSGGAGLRVDVSQREPQRASKYLVSSNFYDALGRMLQSQTVREVNGVEKVVVTRARRYIAGGRIEREYEPFVSTAANTTSPTDLSGAPATQIAYDEFSRPIRRTTPDGRSTTTSRAIAWVTRRCDFNHEADGGGGAGQCTEEEDDGVGRLRYRRKFFGTVSRFLEIRDYDGVGRLLAKTQRDVQSGAQATTRFSYDALGRTTTMVDPDAGTWSYAYDLNGNLTSEDDPKADQRLETDYDGLNRPTERREYAGAGTVARTVYTYDTAPGGHGRLALVDDPSGSTEFNGYDARGNVLLSTKTIAYSGMTRRFSTTSEFDEIGRIASTTYPYPNSTHVEKVFYSYSRTGRLAGVVSEHGAYLKSQQYDERGRITDGGYGNDVHDLYTYAGPGGAYRLQRITTQKAGSSQPYRDVQYGHYDANGNIQLVRDLIHGPTSTRSQTEALIYDDGARLTHAWQCGGTRYESAFVVDLLDNLRSKDQLSYAYGNAPHAPSTYGTDAISYDADGAMTGLPGGRTVTYDARHRVQAVQKGNQSWLYVYDYAGNRVVADTPSGTTFFFGAFDVQGDKISRHVFAGPRIIASSVVSGGNSILAAFPSETPTRMAATLAGTALLFGLGMAGFVPLRDRRRPRGRSRRRVALGVTVVFLAGELVTPFSATAQCPTIQPPPPGTVFYHVDHLGTPQLLTDEAGNVVEHLVTRPYGASAGSFDSAGVGLLTSKSPFRFTGQRADDGSQLIAFLARSYDPRLGMFTTLDPARQFSSPYSYTGGNPVNLADPTGADVTIGFTIGNREGVSTDMPLVGDESGVSSDVTESLDPFDAPVPADISVDDPASSAFEATNGQAIAGFDPIVDIIALWLTGTVLGIVRLVSADASLEALTAGGRIVAGELAAEGATAVAGRGVGQAINVGERGLAHVLARHFPGGAQIAGKSLFDAGEAVPSLARAAESVAPVFQGAGNFQRIVEAGRVIGTDRATGLPTTTYTVITDAAGNLVTMFPGVP